MSRSIRSEVDANRALYLASLKPAAREDWRVILAKREQKRAARHYRQARRPMSQGLAHVGAVLFAAALGVAGAALAVSQLAG